MNQRGRKSAVSTSIKPAASLSAPFEPPEEMASVRKAEWRAMVDQITANFTRGCGSVNDINEATTTFGPRLPSDPVAWDRYRELTKMRGSVGSRLASLATKPRLTTQSRRNGVGTTARLTVGAISETADSDAHYQVGARARGRTTRPKAVRLGKSRHGSRRAMTGNKFCRAGGLPML